MSRTTISTRRITIPVSNAEIPFSVWAAFRNWNKMINRYFISFDGFFANMTNKTISFYNIFNINWFYFVISNFASAAILFFASTSYFFFPIPVIGCLFDLTILFRIFAIGGSLFISVPLLFFFKFFANVIIFSPLFITFFTFILISATIFLIVFAKAINWFFNLSCVKMKWYHYVHSSRHSYCSLNGTIVALARLDPFQVP